MTERKLASIQTITQISPIKDADAIEVARVLGWNVVVKKDQFKVGDKVVYFEIDSWIPTELAPFLSKGKEPRVYEDVLGEKLRTVKLRGVVSQGLILPTHDVHLYLEEKYGDADYDNSGYTIYGSAEPIRWFEAGTDLTDIIGVKKWEAPIPAQLAGLAAGLFPTVLLDKTDAERIQSCFDTIDRTTTYEKTIKLDGTSCTIIIHDGQLRVCSRNLELKICPENAGNLYVKAANSIFEKLNGKVDNIGIQCEIIGEGIQKNQEQIRGHKYFVFTIYDLLTRKQFLPAERRAFCEQFGLDHVPVLEVACQAPNSVEDGLEQAEGPSINAKEREGVVFKSNDDPSKNFKCISNKWLIKNE